jgi:hypothetical protein
LTGRNTLSKNCCSAFKHVYGATITFPLEAKEANTIAGRMVEDFDESSKTLLNSVYDYLSNKSQISAARRVLRENDTTDEDRDDQEVCFGCAGSGKVECSDCKGKGGHLITLEICEEGKQLVEREIWMDGEEGELNFFRKDSAWDEEMEAIRNSEMGHTICSKAKNFSPCDNIKELQRDALKISFVDGDFDLKEGVSNGVDGYLELFNKYIEKCEGIQAAIDEWGDGGECLIKGASLDVVESPCIVRIEFIDKLGFDRVGYVSLASEQVFINEISQEERERQLLELGHEAAGNPNLQNIIGQMYGNYPMYMGYVAKDMVVAVGWFTRAAKAGQADAMNNLGNCYKNGNGVEKDMELAVGWFMRAAKAGQADAMDNLGDCYKRGNGVEKDEYLAAAWYAKAAKAGLPWGQYHYADVLEDGKGVPKDYELAIAWYLKAAKQGVAIAQRRLGCLIEEGQGTEKDEELGNAWKERAKANGCGSSGW